MLCPHCGYKTSERNPSGYCDHIYYPANCPDCVDRERTREIKEAWEKLKIELIKALYLEEIAEFLKKIINKLKGNKHE